MSVYFWCDGFIEFLKYLYFSIFCSHLGDILNILLSDEHVNILLFLILYFVGFNADFESKILFVCISLFSFWKENSLDLDYVSRKSFFYVGLGEDKFKVSGDVALP